MELSIEDAKAKLEAEGYVVLREKSYRQAQDRQRHADTLRAAADEQAARMAEWAQECRDEERRLRDRLTFVYGVARSHGASVDELAGPETDRETRIKEQADQRVADLQAEHVRHINALHRQLERAHARTIPPGV